MMRYSIEYSPETRQHLSVLAAYQRSIVFDEVDRKLMHEPTVETRNRKPMRPNPLAPWELRMGTLWPYYDVIDAPEPTVVVLAVGIKIHNRLYIGGEEVQI
jgi:hypothetical protein